eukprot:Skav201934  [mRNA]  locus=scaffold3992:400348:400803:+ [translate_table: standard]
MCTRTQQVGWGASGLLITGFCVWFVGKQKWDKLEEVKHQDWVGAVAISAGVAQDQYQEAQNIMNIGMAIGGVGAFLWLVLIGISVVKYINDGEETKSLREGHVDVRSGSDSDSEEEHKKCSIYWYNCCFVLTGLVVCYILVDKLWHEERLS